jgi:hypothetical protein
MRDSNDGAPDSQLRRTYQCARNLDPSEQIRECVDQLQHPEIVVAETLEAFRAIDLLVGSRELPPPGDPVDLDAIDLEELGSEVFYATREIAVVGEPCGFTSLGSNVDPLGDLRPSAKGERAGLDYVGLTCDGTRTPVLGTVESQLDTSAYPLLLRGLACLAEISPPHRPRSSVWIDSSSWARWACGRPSISISSCGTTPRKTSARPSIS